MMTEKVEHTNSDNVEHTANAASAHNASEPQSSEAAAQKTDAVNTNNTAADNSAASSVTSNATPNAEASAQTSKESNEEDIVQEAEEVLSAASELEDAKAEVEALKEKYLRLHAEWDTYKRRMNEQREEDKKRATEKLVDNLIPVIDDFERTIDYGTKNGEAGMLEGTQAVLTKLLDALNKSGVEVLNPEGQAFNALEAQAVQMIPDESVPDETVAQVFQKGYRMGNKVLRPAMVVVTSGGPKREEASSETASTDNALSDNANKA